MPRGGSLRKRDSSLARKLSYLDILVLSEENVKGTGEAPHCEQKQAQEELHILNHCPQDVHKSVLGWLETPTQHPAGHEEDRHSIPAASPMVLFDCIWQRCF